MSSILTSLKVGKRTPQKKEKTKDVKERPKVVKESVKEMLKPVQMLKGEYDSVKNQLDLRKDAKPDPSRFITWILNAKFNRLFTEVSYKGNVNDKQQLALYERAMSARITSWEFFGFTKNQRDSRSCLLIHYHPSVVLVYVGPTATRPNQKRLGFGEQDPATGFQKFGVLV